MAAAIGGAANALQAFAGNVSRTGTQAELASVRKEYSACVNCDSASTTQGKANIQALELRMRGLEEKIAAVPPSSSVPAPSPASNVNQTGVDVYA